MPRALQLWLPQPCLRVRGQASGSSAGEKGGICGWQCFPDCGRNRDNNNASTTVNAITMTRPGCPQQRRRPRRRREHHHDSCESYMKHVLSQRNLRRCSCSKQRCSEVWLTRSFLGRGDDLITSLLAHVALLYLRHFYTQIVHGIKKEQIKEWRENQEKDSNCVSALHACASSFQQVDALMYSIYRSRT